jgi:hypothetical protein
VQGIDQKTYLDVFEQKLYSLRKLKQDLQRGLPAPKPEQFLRGLDLIIDAVETFLSRRVDNLRARFAGKPQELAEQIAFHAKVALRILGSLHQQYLPLLHAESQRNEYLFKPSIEQAVGLFTNSRFELTLLPDFLYNYAFDGRENFANSEVELLEKNSDPDTKAALAALRSKAALTQWIVFLHFPVADRDSALNLCVLAHELGHFVDEISKIYKSLLPIELDKSSFDEFVEARCNTPAYGGTTSKPGGPRLTFEKIFTRDGVQARCYLSCNEMLERWIREIIADILAIHAIGPASYFAFNDFMAYMGAENVTSSSHPVPAFRLKLMLDELKETMGYLGSASAVDKVLGEAMLRVTVGAASVKSRYKDEAKVVQITIEKTLTSLLAKIRPVVSAYSFNAARYQGTVPGILERLKRGIAPIEVLDGVRTKVVPASVVGILNAGWELYKTDIAGFYGQFRDDVPEMERFASLNHLLFKAIEASEVKRRWK